jgi:predicted phage terminase large subunit-like protein
MRPERFGPEQVEEAKKTLGSVGYATQHQQRPSPRGGALFKREWWQNRARFSLEDGDAILRMGKPHVLPLNNCSLFIVVDGGASSKQTADPTAMMVFAAGPDGDVFVLHALQQRLEVEDVCPILDDLCLAWRPDWVGIESNGFQVWFTKTARNKQRFRNIPTVRELTPEGKGKAARAAPAIIRAEQGQIWLPYTTDETCPWVGEFEEELYSFTGKEGASDHFVDCVAYCVLQVDRLGYDVVEELPVPDPRLPGWHPGRW